MTVFWPKMTEIDWFLAQNDWFLAQNDWFLAQNDWNSLKFTENYPNLTENHWKLPEFWMKITENDWKSLKFTEFHWKSGGWGGQGHPPDHGCWVGTSPYTLIYTPGHHHPTGHHAGHRLQCCSVTSTGCRDPFTRLLSFRSLKPC